MCLTGGKSTAGSLSTDGSLVSDIDRLKQSLGDQVQHAISLSLSSSPKERERLSESAKRGRHEDRDKGDDDAKSTRGREDWRSMQPCRWFAKGHCSYGDKCRFSHEESGEGKREGKGEGARRERSEGKGRAGKGGREGEEQSVKRRKEEKVVVGSRGHEVDYSKRGHLQLSKGSRWFSMADCDDLLVRKFGYKPADAKKMCHAVGLDFYPGAAKCPVPRRHGHTTADDFCHRFPKDFAQVARDELPKRFE